MVLRQHLQSLGLSLSTTKYKLKFYSEAIFTSKPHYSLKINNLPGIYDYLAKKQKPGYDYNNDGIVDPAPIEPLFNLDFSSPKTEQETEQETEKGGFNFNATRDFT